MIRRRALRLLTLLAYALSSASEAIVELAIRLIPTPMPQIVPPLSPAPTPTPIRLAAPTAFDWPEPMVPLSLQSCPQARWPFTGARVHYDQWVREQGQA